MKKVRSIINIALGTMIAALGLSSCERFVKYGAPPIEDLDSSYLDTTVRCMYGVNPNPVIQWDEDNE